MTAAFQAELNETCRLAALLPPSTDSRQEQLSRLLDGQPSGSLDGQPGFLDGQRQGPLMDSRQGLLTDARQGSLTGEAS